MTIAFDGLAFVTGSYCAQTFYPPGKVADFFGFQYLRDNDPSGMGHNTDFTTLTADPILVLLTDAQLQTLADLGEAEVDLNEAYGYARLPLADAFRRLLDGDTPSGHPELSREAVKAFSAALFSIDGQMSFGKNPWCTTPRSIIARGADMNVKTTVLALIVSIYTGGLSAQDHAPSPRADARGAHAPPPQAYEDCRGKQVGAAVAHMTREGLVAATCADSPDGLVARPNQPPSAQADGPAAPANRQATPAPAAGRQ